ncbi:hypothetical protein PUN4_2270001 [Paraburkholderia unamae]|nr:hypothetical protein PUN4_2270001 [Paraburkholderia unamae]
MLTELSLADNFWKAIVNALKKLPFLQIWKRFFLGSRKRLPDLAATIFRVESGLDQDSLRYAIRLLPDQLRI